MHSLKEFLQGDWRLRRTVSDLCNGDVATMSGIASFKEHQQGLWYREQGQLTLFGYSGPFFQEYLYRFPAPHRADVCFPDGRLFYEFDVPALLQDLGSSKLHSRSSRTPQYAAASRSVFPAHILNYRGYTCKNPCDVVHTCGLDQYRGKICMEDQDKLAFEWLVQGPRKNTKILSCLQRRA